VPTYFLLTSSTVDRSRSGFDQVFEKHLLPEGFIDESSLFVALLTHPILLLLSVMQDFLLFGAILAENLTTHAAVVPPEEESELAGALFAVGGLMVRDIIFFLT
jgi:hypothetical protein